MKKITAYKIPIVEIISFLFILLFVYTASSKLIDRVVFEDNINRMPLLAGSGQVISWGVLLTEIFVSILLVFPVTRLLGLYGSLLLLLIFTFYLGYMLLSRVTLPCSCGGIIAGLSWRQHFSLNTFLILLAAIGILRSTKVTLFRSAERMARVN